MTHQVTLVGSTITTPRVADPAMDRIDDLHQMRAVISGWIGTPPGARRAIERPVDPIVSSWSNWVCPYCAEAAHRHRAGHLVPK